MTTIFEHVETALGTISPAVSFALAPYKGTLPDAYIVHQLIVSPAEQHADNDEIERSYTVQLTLWDVAGVPSITSVNTAMKAAGFHLSDIHQVPQDPQTHHYGLAVEYIYLEPRSES